MARSTVKGLREPPLTHLGPSISSRSRPATLHDWLLVEDRSVAGRRFVQGNLSTRRILIARLESASGAAVGRHCDTDSEFDVPGVSGLLGNGEEGIVCRWRKVR